jgi:hypothetical protein
MDPPVSRKYFEETIDRVSIKPLLPHYERGALCLLIETLDLIDVALAIAENDSEKVSKWIQDQALRKPRKEEIERWSKDVLAQHFEFLIVQPFVLAKYHEGGEAIWRKKKEAN